MSEISTLDERYIRNPEVVLREEDETEGGLLFNPDTNDIIVINPTGLFIWKHCDGQNNLETIVNAMQQAFEDAPTDQVRQDVLEFIEEMLKTGFVGTIRK